MRGRAFADGIAPRVVALATAAALTSACAPADPAPPAGEPPTALDAPVDGPQLDGATALALATLPLACIDRPHGAPQRTGYLYQPTWSLRTDFESTRAFYGCYDWHSAVNSTWTLVTLLRRFPGLPVAPLIVEKLRQHLAPGPLAGEMEYFEANPAFERPYGWSWYLLLHAELVRLEHPLASEWVEATAPLADVFANGLTAYLDRLDYPLRNGTHANTAFAIDLALEFARVTGRRAMVETLARRARDLFGSDRHCPLDFEPSASDFLSPCLTEAALMADVLPPEGLPGWLTDFLPATDDDAFTRLRAPARLTAEAGELDVGEQGARSHLIGLAFTRAEALSRLATALGPEDPRSAAYRAVAGELATWGMATMFDADYLGSHWIGTFATRYLVTLSVPATE